MSRNAAVMDAIKQPSFERRSRRDRKQTTKDVGNSQAKLTEQVPVGISSIKGSDAQEISLIECQEDADLNPYADPSNFK